MGKLFGSREEKGTKQDLVKAKVGFNKAKVNSADPPGNSEAGMTLVLS